MERDRNGTAFLVVALVVLLAAIVSGTVLEALDHDATQNWVIAGIAAGGLFGQYVPAPARRT